MIEADPNKVLIVGFGYVGQCLARRLLTTAAGLDRAAYCVYAMRRSQAQLPSHPGLVFLKGDARNINAESGAPADLGQVVCAVSPDERTEAAYRAAYPEVVSALLKQFPRARIILVSSTAVYGQTNAQQVDERAPADALQPTAQQLKRAEDLLLHSAHNSVAHSAAPDRAQTSPPLAHVVVRPSGIYGPGRTRLIASLLNHDLPGSEQGAFSSRIHRDDLVGILEFLLERRELSGVFNASDPHPAQLGEIARWVRQELRQGKLPGSAVTREHKDRKIVPARLLELGYTFQFPSYIEGYRQVFEADGIVESQPLTG